MPKHRFDRGDVWLADFGMAAKTRPGVIVNIALDPNDRALLALVPHTTSLQSTHFEIAVPKRFLKTGAFNIQGITNLSFPRLIRRLGSLLPDEILLIEASLKHWLGLEQPQPAQTNTTPTP